MAIFGAVLVGLFLLLPVFGVNISWRGGSLVVESTIAITESEINDGEDVLTRAFQVVAPIGQ